MEDLILALGWIGVFAPVALGAVGSAIGCSVAGQAACGAMLDVESGYGKFVGLSADAFFSRLSTVSSSCSP